MPIAGDVGTHEGRRPKEKSMKENLSEYLPWLLSALSLAMAWLTGSRLRGAWLFGLLVVQPIWLLWIWADSKWGFTVLTAALMLIYARNWWLWKHEEGSGWVVADAQGDSFRAWGDWGPGWVDDAEEALFFARRRDAEAFCAEDEDAWRIIKMQFKETKQPAAVYNKFPPPPWIGPVAVQGRRYERALQMLMEEQRITRKALLSRLDDDTRW